MFFDDRLATVLRQRGDSETGARTQFRQLLDILGNRKFGPKHSTNQSLIAAAWLRMDALAKAIPTNDRAAAIRERGWRLRSADLTAHLADFEPEVASAALGRADLSEDDWTGLIPRLPVRARGFLRRRDDLPLDAEALLDRLGVHDRGLPQPGKSASDVITDAPRTTTARIASPPPFLPPRTRPTNYDLEPANEPFELEDEVPEDVEAVELGKESGDDASVFSGLSAEPEAEPEIEGDPSRNEISALVERIAQFKRDRDVAQSLESAPRLPLEDHERPGPRELSSFGFAADAAGRIEWAEPQAAAMIVGKRIVPPQAFANPAAQTLIERAFDRRQPIACAPISLSGAPAITGEWVLDAQPHFTDAGNFTGYVGRFRRPAQSGKDAQNSREEADRIRQLLHELRTPVTAVQGYAEVIQQQLFGPARHEYRALAAAIAADAARILAGFEELDRLARLETGASDITTGEADLSAIITRITGQLSGVLGPRMAGIEFVESESAPLQVAIDPEEAEALIWRVLATLGGACASGETITCQLLRDGHLVRLICELPAQLIAEDDIFTADVKIKGNAVNAGLFGAGFTLRLARAEARAAKGGLVHEDEHLSLALPLLTADSTLTSQTETTGESEATETGHDAKKVTRPRRADHHANGKA